MIRSGMSDAKPDAATPNSMEDLCRRAAAGEGDALEALLCAHHQRLLSFVRRKIGVQWQAKIDPEDVLQEAYTEAFAAISGFTYQGEESFYRWMTTIVDHRFYHLVRHWRAKKRSAAREVSGRRSSAEGYRSLLDDCLRHTDTPSRFMRRADAAGALMSCLARLPEDSRTAIQRLHLSEEPLSAVAADMGRSEDAVRRLASRAVAQLSKCLGRASRYLSDGA